MVNLEFKAAAEAAAFKSFIKVMKKYRLYFLVLPELYRFSVNSSMEAKVDCKMVNNLIPESFARNTMNWQNLHDNLIRAIDNNASNSRGMMGGGGSPEYDYLIHCVNTMIQVFVEFRLAKKGEHRKQRIPEFQMLGQEIFNSAARHLFGADFVDDQPAVPNQAIPRNNEEAMMADKWFNQFMQNGMNEQQAAMETSRKLMEYRRQNGEGGVSGSDFYINQGNNYNDEYYDDEYYDEDNDW